MELSNPDKFCEMFQLSLTPVFYTRVRFVFTLCVSNEAIVSLQLNDDIRLSAIHVWNVFVFPELKFSPSPQKGKTGPGTQR